MINSKKIVIKRPSNANLEETIALPASKSISNRALIINALANAPSNSNLHNLSSARDTELMYNLIGSSDEVIDVREAGTTMRFLLAYFSVRGAKKILTGTERMKQRPIKILVDALRDLGVEITYLENEGFPPVKIEGFTGQKKSSIEMLGNVSSQYISAMMMIAPVLPNGLTIHLRGKVGSIPYIKMTQGMMEDFGAQVHWDQNTITIPSGSFQPIEYAIEPDWSAASYWYSIISLAQKGKILLEGLTKKSIQGDSVIAEIMKNAGVSTTFNSSGALLEFSDKKEEITYDFIDCPDIAQTVAVVAGARNIGCTMYGLQSLKIKETDRIKALQNELAKFNIELTEQENVWKVRSDGANLSGDSIVIKTYEDHRMAMAFAPLSIFTPLIIEDPKVVAKSYPHYWDDLAKTGFEISDF